jgi:PTS system ascorbate-specific IIA component
VLAQAFGPNSISHHLAATDWEGAISAAVSLLELDQRVSSSYLSRVLEANQKHGPYFVVAPGIAIAHAAPGDDVLETGMALLRLENPVVSGSANDPVSLLFAFCAVDSTNHIALLSQFAEVMSNAGNVNSLLIETNLTIVRNLLTA